jgi:predicted  nucleic acid-binding Zn-ribbon protein
LEVEKLKYSNLQQELMGVEEEIEFLRNQKSSLNEALNEQQDMNQDLLEKSNEKSEKIIQLESKLHKYKEKYKPENEDSLSSSSSEDYQTIASLKEELSDLVSKLSRNRTKYNQLKEENDLLHQTVAELEITIISVKNELNEKDKEVHTLRTTAKDNGSSPSGNANSQKLFRALAEELQSEKAKSLKLSTQLKQITEDKQTIVQKQKNLEEELLSEKNKSTQLLQELSLFRNTFTNDLSLKSSSFPIYRPKEELDQHVLAQSSPGQNPNHYQGFQISEEHPHNGNGSHLNLLLTEHENETIDEIPETDDYE